MPQDPALPPKDPALPPGAGKRKIRLRASPEDSAADALRKIEQAKLRSMAGREFDSPQALAKAFKSATPGPDPTGPAPKVPLRRTDWAEKTRKYATALNDAYVMFKTAKRALTPPDPESKLTIQGRKKRAVSQDPDDHRYEFYGDGTPLMKTFYGRTKEGTPGAEYQREVASMELPGASVDEKLAKLGKTAAEAQADLESAEKVLNDVANSYQNDIHELLGPLEAKRDELESRIEKASGGRVATGRGQKDVPAPAPKEAPAPTAQVPAAAPSGDPALPPKSADPALPPRPTFKTTSDRVPSLDRSVSTARLSGELYNINNRIVRAYKTIETIQKIVSKDDRSLFTKRWDPDPEVARFVALLYLIANRDLAGMYVDDGMDWVVNAKGQGRWVPRSSSKMGVLRGPGDKYYEGDELKGVPKVPERPPTDVPPVEAIQRFVQILEGVSLEAALTHALLTGTPLCESAKSLTAGYFRLKGFSGNESFLNGRYCHLVSSKDDYLIVKILDEDIHKDDRIFRVSFDEAELIDGVM